MQGVYGMTVKKISILLFLTALIMTVFPGCGGKRGGPSVPASVIPEEEADSNDVVPAVPVQDVGGSVTTVSTVPPAVDAVPSANMPDAGALTPPETVAPVVTVPKAAVLTPPAADTSSPPVTDSGGAMAYFNQAVTYYEAGDYDQTIAALTDAIRLNPNYVAAYVNRGIVYTIKEDYDRAITDHNEAIRLNPNNSEAYNNRGYAYAMKEDYDRAQADWEKALEFDPNNTSARNNLTTLFAEQILREMGD
jgi:Tfp pilus assembly protein PilF